MSTTTIPPLATTDPELPTETKVKKESSKKKSNSSSAKRSKKRPSNDAWVMGYVISNEDFLCFISSLRNPETVANKGPLSLEASIMYYDSFKRGLPKNLERYAPELEEIYKSRKLMDSELPLEDTISHMFFPIRCIPYKSKEQLSDSHPDSKIIREEYYKDKVQMTRLVEHVQSRGGKLDFDMVKYGYEKMLHPRFW